MNVDSAALTDPRFRKLAKTLAVTWQEALGRCVSVWMLASDRRSAVLPIDDVDIVAERDGFAAAMVAVNLADELADDAIRVRIRGIDERIRFLLDQKGRAHRRWNTKAHANADAEALAEADANAYAYSPDQAPDQAPKEDPLATAACDAINRATGARYQPDSQEVAKNCKALAKAGVTTEQLVRVIEAKAGEWSKSDQMRGQIKPSVLTRPSNVRRYLDDLAAKPARAQMRALAPAADLFINGERVSLAPAKEVA